MKSKKITRKVKLSQPPGTLVHLGERKADMVTIDLTFYNKDIFEKKAVDSTCCWLKEKSPQLVYWLTVNGLHDIESIQQIGKSFSLHALILEDILNTMHRSKIEDLDDYIFIILKLIRFDKSEKKIKTEHASFVLLSNSVLAFHERESDIFLPVRQRLQKAIGRLRQFGSDYLLYALIDSVVDNYFMVLESLGQEIEELELSLFAEPTPDTLQIIQKLKKEMINFRKAAIPLREIIISLLKSDSKLVKKSTGLFLRDVYDHISQVTEMIEIYREMISGIQDLYLSSISNKMNEIMKMLTIIATIFIPLTFIAGIYGMNFEFMPELKWNFGYFFILGIMTTLAVVMVIYFKRKKWL